MEEQNIMDTILAEARGEAQKIIDEAKYESGKVVEEDKKKIEKEKEKQIQEYREEMANHKESQINVCELEARNKVLAEKQKWIEKVKRDVQNKIKNTNAKEYVSLIETMLQYAELKPQGVILLPVKEREAITEIAKNKGLEVRPVDNFEAGFVLQYGNVEYNYVLDTMLELQQEKVDEMIVKVLFG